VGGKDILGYRYRLVDQLGVGGMGVVWRAYDEVLDRQVAVKVLAAQYAGDAESRQRVLAEARAAAKLTHPHIAAVYDYGESVTDAGERVPFVVMELLNGRSLQQRLKRGQLSIELSLRVCAETAAALAAAHAQNVVHRDVKPANVMLTPSGAKVVDFGLAAIAGERDYTDGTEMMLGTPAYLAPERLAGQAVVAATDVYALGLLLYRMLAGRLPWSTETTTQMLDAHVYREPPPLPRIHGVPRVVSDLVHRCLAKDPAARPSSREVTVTLAHAAGVWVPLDGADHHELVGESTGDVTAAAAEAGSGSSSGRGKAAVRSGPLAAVSAGAVSPADPYAARLGTHLDASADHVSLRRQASLLLHGAVGFDLAIWAVLDPMTLMWSSCVIEGGPYDSEFEHELFVNEYGQDDVLTLVEVAEGPRLATLSGTLEGELHRSRRFRNILQPRGFRDELRQTFYDSEGTWGALLLYRASGPFTEADVTHLAPASRPFGTVLHQALVRGDAVPEDAPPAEAESHAVPAVPEPRPAPTPASRSFRLTLPWLSRSGRDSRQGAQAAQSPVATENEPARPPAPIPVSRPPASPPRPPVAGTLEISHDGRLLDVSEDARTLLDAAELDRVGTAVARGKQTGLVDTTGTRHDGRWLAFHAAPGETALSVTVQRIRPHQVSEFVARAHGLEPWQWRLLGAIARGRNTRQIAQDLNISTYAVQDAMMTLFKAFRVSGRLELVKALFFDHYVPMHAADVFVPPR
jgi:DNA-binding CsgD family transcriptional regulator